jgi:hypothetical protein
MDNYTEQEIADYLKAKQKSRDFYEKHSKEMPFITSFALDAADNKKSMEVK